IPARCFQRNLRRAARVAFLWKAARKKARMQTHTGLSKTGDGVVIIFYAICLLYSSGEFNKFLI
ncbi:hypothetical protein ACVWDN_24890, partial [Escherichia coli]